MTRPTATNHARPRPAAGWCLFATPVGHCGVAWTADGRMAGAQLPGLTEAAGRQRMQARFGAAGGPLAESDGPAHVQRWIARLRAVMAGASRDDLADIALADEGLPPFQRRVWAAARQLPPGQTRTYAQMAEGLGEPGAARAVGQALGANPFAPFVPCHRVLAAHGRAGGFSAAGGASTKLRLLELEGARFEFEPGQPGLF